jgi:hypothetical protein
LVCKKTRGVIVPMISPVLLSLTGAVVFSPIGMVPVEE